MLLQDNISVLEHRGSLYKERDCLRSHAIYKEWVYRYRIAIVWGIVGSRILPVWANQCGRKYWTWNCRSIIDVIPILSIKVARLGDRFCWHCQRISATEKGDSRLEFISMISTIGKNFWKPTSTNSRCTIYFMCVPNQLFPMSLRLDGNKLFMFELY